MKLPAVRILLWHGYLLGGTGSNVYTRAIAREWARAGHDVVVVSQEGNPELYDLGGARTVRPDLGGLLPVFVLDRYEGLEAKLLQDTTEEERQHKRRAAKSAGCRLASTWSTRPVVTSPSRSRPAKSAYRGNVATSK